MFISQHVEEVGGVECLELWLSVVPRCGDGIEVCRTLKYGGVFFAVSQVEEGGRDCEQKTGRHHKASEEEEIGECFSERLDLMAEELSDDDDGLQQHSGGGVGRFECLILRYECDRVDGVAGDQRERDERDEC